MWMENIFIKNQIFQDWETFIALEIYNMIKDLPGDILEFGVFKGSSLIRFLTFRAI